MIAKFLNESIVPRNNDMELLDTINKYFERSGTRMTPANLNLSDGKPGNWFVRTDDDGKPDIIVYSGSRGNAFGGKVDFIVVAERDDSNATGYTFGDYISPETYGSLTRKRSAYVRNIVRTMGKIERYMAIYKFVNKEFLKCIDSGAFDKD